MITKIKCYKNQVWINHISRYVLSSNFINLLFECEALPCCKWPIWISQISQDNTRCSSWWIRLQAAHETPTHTLRWHFTVLTPAWPLRYQLMCSESFSLVLPLLPSSVFYLHSAFVDLDQGFNYKSTDCHIYVFPWAQFPWVKGTKIKENSTEDLLIRDIINKGRNTWSVIIIYGNYWNSTYFK